MKVQSCSSVDPHQTKELSQIYGMIWVGRSLKKHLVPSPCWLGQQEETVTSVSFNSYLCYSISKDQDPRESILGCNKSTSLSITAQLEPKAGQHPAVPGNFGTAQVGGCKGSLDPVWEYKPGVNSSGGSLRAPRTLQLSKGWSHSLLGEYFLLCEWELKLIILSAMETRREAPLCRQQMEL